MARNRNRQPGPIRRTVLTPALRADQPVSRNLAARTPHESFASAPRDGAAGARIRRTRASIKGQAGPWSEPQYLHPLSTAMTSAWSRTKSD